MPSPSPSSIATKARPDERAHTVQDVRSAADEATLSATAELRVLAIAEEFLVCHDRLVRVGGAHMRYVGIVIRHSDHQSCAIAKAAPDIGETTFQYGPGLSC